jgi:hypothetical protein
MTALRLIRVFDVLHEYACTLEPARDLSSRPLHPLASRPVEKPGLPGLPGLALGLAQRRGFFLDQVPGLFDVRGSCADVADRQAQRKAAA